MRHVVVSLSLLVLSISNVFCNAPSWEKLTGCTLISGAWRDGDSFHVRHSGKEYIFRLYFVDTPEDETRFPERVKEQAQYFGVSSERALQVGHMAAEYTHDVLDGKSFTVWTCWEDAMGSSQQQRFYAFVDVDGTPLASLLVANGFARIYGKNVTLPNGADSTNYLTKLEGLQAQAKVQKKGGWGQGARVGEIEIIPEDEEDEEFEFVGPGNEIPAY